MYLIFLLLMLRVSLCVSDDRVRFAVVLFRHGDRTPVDPYPTDPWRNESFWPVRFGQLTNIGKMQHFLLGKWLRIRYSHMISKGYDPKEIYVRSTDVDRTLMSAQANLAGMYPPVGPSTWNTDLMWQPIPIHTVPEEDDELLAMKRSCPAYTQLMKEFIESKPYKERLDKYQPMMDYLSAYTGMKVKDYNDMASIYSTLYIEQLYNFTLPRWTATVFPDKLKEPAGYSFRVDTYNAKLSRLKIGPFLKEVTYKMLDIVQSSKNGKGPMKQKLLVYSGHDFTVASLLNALGMYDGVSPVYTATVIMELIYYNTTDTHYVQISYRNSTDIIEPYILDIPFCGKLCNVHRFVKLYETLVTVDWDKDCQPQLPATLLYLGISVSLLLILLFFGNKQSYSNNDDQMDELDNTSFKY